MLIQKKSAAIVLSLLTLLSLAGCARSGDAAMTTTNPIVQYHEMGDTASIEGYQVAILSASRIGAEELNLDEGLCGLALDCTITNESGTCREVCSTLMFRLLDEDCTTRNILLDENMQGGLDGELGTGQSLSGTIIFSVLEDQTEWQLTFKPDRFQLDAQAVFVISASDVS